MLSRLGSLCRIGRYFHIDIVDGKQMDVSQLENISNLPFYRSFKEGLNLTLENKLEQANSHFQKSLSLLQDKKEQMRDHYLHIFKKVIMNNYQLGRFKMVEENLYTMIKMKKKAKIQELLIYDDYNSLMQLFLRYDAKKAILLGKALLNQKDTNMMSLKHIKLFQFNLGNAYFLVGNYEDAKTKFSECIQSYPNQDMQIKAYNNLAVSCWFNKNSIINEKLINVSNKSPDKIDADFKQTRQILLKAIQIGQKADALASEQSKYRLNQVLSQTQLDIQLNFTSSSSIIPIYNLCQYYIYNQPKEKIKIIFWMNKLLRLCKLFKNQQIFTEIYTTLKLLNNQKNGLLQQIKQLRKNQKKTILNLYLAKIELFLLRSTESKQECTSLSNQIAQLQNYLNISDQYSHKRKFMCSYEFAI